ncbi:MAG: hypothetical protein Q9195_000544 [Heterodermia aff. obscurata]
MPPQRERRPPVDFVSQYAALGHRVIVAPNLRQLAPANSSKPTKTTWSEANELLKIEMPDLFLKTNTIAIDEQRKKLAKILSGSHDVKNAELVRLWKLVNDTVIVPDDKVIKKVKRPDSI